MKKIVSGFCFAVFLLSCNSNKTESTSTSTDTTAKKTMAEMPYTASYSSNFTQDVSDADLKTVLQSYKDWENNNMPGLANAMGDTVSLDLSTGEHKKMSRADLMKFWTTIRDSLSSVKIDMGAWLKMYEPTKKDQFVVTWYDETDTYKTGKVDSATYHDINQVKDGKIVWFAQYKRPKK